MCHSHIEKPVVEMPAIGGERRLSREEAADEHVEGVDDRNAEHEKGRRDLRRSEDRKDREHRPEEHDAGRAEKEPRRMEVEEQEPCDRPGEREAHPRDERLGDLRQKRETSEGQRRDRGDTCGKAVETIDEVERVIHPDDPEHRERDGNGKRKLDETIGERVIHEIDVDAGDHDHRRDDDLSEKLPASAELEQIVEQADRHPEHRGDRGQGESRRADLLRDKEGMTRDPVDKPEHEDRRSECDRDRETPRPRDRTGMAPTSPWHVEHAEPTGEHTDDWRRDRGQCEREDR